METCILLHIKKTLENGASNGCMIWSKRFQILLIFCTPILWYMVMLLVQVSWSATPFMALWSINGPFLVTFAPLDVKSPSGVQRGIFADGMYL
jgi:hypothetical protein